MLRIIHTGRAYEVLDLASPVHCLTERNIYWRFWQQGIELEKTCRETGDLKELLKSTTNRNLELQIELELCQKSTHHTHVPQDPH